MRKKTVKVRYGVRSRKCACVEELQHAGLTATPSREVQQNQQLLTRAAHIANWTINVLWAKAEGPDFFKVPSLVWRTCQKVLTALPKWARALNCWGHTFISDTSTVSAKSKIYSVTEFSLCWFYNQPSVWNALRSYHRRIQTPRWQVGI